MFSSMRPGTVARRLVEPLVLARSDSAVERLAHRRVPSMRHWRPHHQTADNIALRTTPREAPQAGPADAQTEMYVCSG
jgi:hypothetical protein